MYSNPEKRVKELEQQIEDERYERERKAEQAYQEREHLRRERRQEWQEAQLYANDWPDAFAKGLPRLRSEAAGEREVNEYESNLPESERLNHNPLHWFIDLVPDVEAAKVIYYAEMENAQREIINLEAQIQKVKQDALNRVADRVKSPELAEAFRENNPNWLTNW